MNVLFVYSRQDYQTKARPLENPQQIQFGISYISALLKKHGHSTRLLVLTRETKKKIIDEYLTDFRPSLICFSAVYTEYEFISGIAKYIKAHYPDIYLLAGGPHVSLRPQDCLSGSFDALCIGEGEYPTLELVEHLQGNLKPGRIPNLWIKHGKDVERNPTRPFLQEIDKLPFPDREMWQEWIADPKGRASILAARGCPFQCTYCCNHAIRKLSTGSYVRFRSPDNILEEINDIAVNYPAVKEIFFEAETLILNKDFVFELCEKLEHVIPTLNRSIYFGAIMRVIPGVDVESIFAAFKKTNFRFINIGVESGSQRMRKLILKRNYSNQDIIRVSAAARKYGLKICFYNLIGLPEETMDDFRETVNINRACLPDWHFLSIFFPYPGTDLYNLCMEKGLIKGALDPEMERSKVALNFSEPEKRQIEKNYVWFDYYVYKGHRPLYKILARVFVSKLKMNYRFNVFYRRLTNYSIFLWLRDFLRRY